MYCYAWLALRTTVHQNQRRMRNQKKAFGIFYLEIIAFVKIEQVMRIQFSTQ